MTPAHRARRVVLQVVGLTGAVAGLTVLFLGMRSVMDVGGSCGSGGPYVVATPCPDNAWLIPVGLMGGAALLFVYALSCFGDGGPRLLALAWPALFISLGWNFMEYGLDPPGGDGPVWGWLVCGVLFWLMGGLPLILLVRHGRALLWGPPAGAPAAAGRVPGYVPLRPSRRAQAAPRTASRDLVGRLERLDALRRGGALDDAEYERVKDELLREEGLA